MRRSLNLVNLSRVESGYNLLSEVMKYERRQNMQAPEEDMYVDLDLDDGTNVHCQVLTILEVDGHDYVALLPEIEQENEEETEVWFYEIVENKDDPNEEPELLYIESDEVYDAVTDKFEEYLDELEFDEMDDESEES